MPNCYSLLQLREESIVNSPRLYKLLMLGFLTRFRKVTTMTRPILIRRSKKLIFSTASLKSLRRFLASGDLTANAKRLFLDALVTYSRARKESRDCHWRGDWRSAVRTSTLLSSRVCVDRPNIYCVHFLVCAFSSPKTEVTSCRRTAS